MMASIYELTKRGVFGNRRFLRTIDGAGQKIHAQHCNIANCIFDGDPKGAAAAARFHLDFIELSFRTGHERDARERLAQKRKLLMKTY